MIMVVKFRKVDLKFQITPKYGGLESMRTNV